MARADDEAFGHVDECCGQPTEWDPEAVGKTCGGLEVRGAWWCHVCLKQYLGKDTVANERWSISNGGRSVETGIGRIRVDGGKGVEDLIKRIARLPELEAAERKAASKPKATPTDTSTREGIRKAMTRALALVEDLGEEITDDKVGEDEWTQFDVNRIGRDVRCAGMLLAECLQKLAQVGTWNKPTK